MASTAEIEVNQQPLYASSYTSINDRLGGPAAQASYSVFSEEFAEPGKITETCQKFMAFANDHNDELWGIRGFDKNSQLTSIEAIPGESTDMLVTIKSMNSNGELNANERYSKVPVTDVINLAKDYDRAGPASSKSEHTEASTKSISSGPQADNATMSIE